MKCLICHISLRNELEAIERHYIQEHHAMENNLYLAAYLVGKTKTNVRKRHTSSFCGVKRQNVRGYNSHMLKHHLMYGAGIDSPHSIFTTVKNSVQGINIYNFKYTPSAKNQKVINNKTIGSFKLLLNAFEKKLR